MRTFDRKEIENLVKYAKELVDYMIDDEARNYAECKDSAIHDHEYKHDLDNHIYTAVREVAKITKYKRLDLRFTVDNPEDLVLCRKIYSDLMDGDFHMPIEDIINWADRNDEWRRLVDPFVDGKAIWAHVIDE